MEFKPLEMFPIRPGRPSFYRDCTPCRKAQMAEYRKENKWKVDIMHKNYRIIHRKEIRNKNRERARIEREIDPLPRLEATKKYRDTDKCKATKKRGRRR